MNAHSTTRRVVRSSVLLAFATIVVVLSLRPRAQDEPTLHGKPLSHYLDLQTYGELRTEREARTSISDFGSNALPHLIRILETRPTRFDEVLEKLSLRLPFLRSHYTPLGLRQDQAILACAELGPTAAPAIPALSNLVNHPAHDRIAITALAVIGPQNFPILTNSLHSGIPSARAAAAGMLRVLGQDSFAVAPLLRALGDPVAEVRGNAAGSLALVGANDSNTVPALAVILSDTDPTVRLEAIQGLERLQEKARPAASRLRALLKAEENPTLQHRIEQALKAIESNQPPAP